MNLNKIRILGSGFTEEEYRLYEFDRLDHPDAAMRYLSHRLNNRVYRPLVNSSAQRHVLEDKWITYHYLSSLGVPIPRTYGLFHPRIGVTFAGAPLTDADQLAAALPPEFSGKLVLKPRGGRQGRHVEVVAIERADAGQIRVRLSADRVLALAEFLARLPHDAFDHYDGSYHGWLIQEYISQHEFINKISPYTVNSIRVMTFLDTRNEVQIHHAVLRVGRSHGIVDSWAQGGIGIAIDPETGELGKGVYKPAKGAGWLSVHPDTGVRFEGLRIPEWPTIAALARRAALLFSGIRSIGWDIVLTPDGPLINEGNAEWDLAFIQVHSQGYLTEALRAELAHYGARFPRRAKSLPAALVALAFDELKRAYRWQRAKMSRRRAPHPGDDAERKAGVVAVTKGQ